MKKEIRFILALITLLTVMLACANPVSGTAPANVETIVASTLSALTAPAPGAGPSPQPPTSDLLPHSMYFLNNDGKGIPQIYRLEKDGKTVTQITFEPAKVESYDVSLVDGSVAYVSNNQILTVRPDGSNRSMVVDGGPTDPNNLYVNHLGAPLWSLDAQTITYGFHGINVYSIASGQPTLVYQDQLTTENGVTLGQVNIPASYSPDGSKLLVNIVPLASDGGLMGIFSPANKSLMPLSSSNHRICCALEWSADNNTLYGSNASFNPFSTPGLWRVDATSGAVTDLVASTDTILNFASSPYLAPNGQLYFFYATQPYAQQDEINRVPLQLVRSAVDGVTGRTVVIPNAFNTLNEALWAPDASFVITASGPIADVYEGGILELFYTDGQRPMISLLPFAFDLKWGP